jgi:hypothetical protein
MRVTGITINQMILKAKSQPLDRVRAVYIGKLRALRAVYETSVYARFTLPVVGPQQRSLREAICVAKELRDMGMPRGKLQREIREARRVPMDLDMEMLATLTDAGDKP